MAEFTTGAEVLKKSHEVFWKISNFPTVQFCDKRLAMEKIEFDFGEPTTIWSKWLAYLKPNSSDVLVLYLRNLDEVSNGSSPCYKISICYSFGGKMGPYVLAQKVKNLKNVTKSWEIGCQTELSAKICPSEWKRKLDDKCTLYLKIQLSSKVVRDLGQGTSIRAMDTLKIAGREKLLTDLVSLRKQATYGDVEIVCCDGEQILAHRAILSARNVVFHSMLRVEMKERVTGQIKVDDISGPTMKVLLHYFYTGELLPGWSEADIIHEFVYAAGKYLITEVLNMLDNVLGSDKISTCDMKLLCLVTKLGLKKAEVRLTAKLGRMACTIKSGDEFLKIFSSQ